MKETDANVVAESERTSRAVPTTCAPPRHDDGAVVLAIIDQITRTDALLITFVGSPKRSPALARSIITLSPEHVGRTVLVMFERGDPMRPIVVGLMNPTSGDSMECSGIEARNGGQTAVVQVDGQRVILTAEEEVVLRCGDASITLTRAGKVLIRGNYVVTRSTGVNRIKGAAVQIN